MSEFAREMAAAHEQFALEIQRIICTFRSKSEDLKNNRLVESPSTIFNAWENLLKETEMDGQAHLDAASLLMRNVCEPLYEVAQHKQSQAQKLQTFRDNFQDLLSQSEANFEKAEQNYQNTYHIYKNCDVLNNREELRHDFHNAHNEYILHIRASNRSIDEFQVAIPQVLEELDEIYIDTSNTINVAIESHSLLLLTKANEQQRRFESLLKICRQVNPQLDISYFTKMFSLEEAKKEYTKHKFSPVDHAIVTEESVMSHLILDRVTEIVLHDRRAALQKEALELTSYIKQNQDVTHTLVNICQRNLANHLYAKVYETQEDMCRKRNEIRIANMQLGAVRSQIELLTPKQNGSIDDDQDKKNPSTIRGMWKKAFKNLKSSASEPKLTKKSSLIKKKQNSKEGEEEVEPETSGVVDPVYSLLKCAADLPKGGGGGVKSPCLIHPHCSGHHQTPSYNRYPSGGDSSGNTSKTSSPSSSEFQDIVTDGLGSGFKQYYKITSPAKKTTSVFDTALT